MSIRNEIKSQIIRAGFTMQEVVDRLADVLDCDIVWVKRGARR